MGVKADIDLSVDVCKDPIEVTVDGTVDGKQLPKETSKLLNISLVPLGQLSMKAGFKDDEEGQLEVVIDLMGVSAKPSSKDIVLPITKNKACKRKQDPFQLWIIIAASMGGLIVLLSLLSLAYCCVRRPSWCCCCSSRKQPFTAFHNSNSDLEHTQATAQPRVELATLASVNGNQGAASEA
eukprot:m.5267 g.5267  ORF g.5267 m.5267 type:complete len:181 (+) comp7537_c0_seq1:1175-1717(+)